MKKKILASLLAVCMFAGMAVPAFAASHNSSQAGDSSEVNKVTFKDASYTIAKDDAKEFDGEVRAFVNDSKLVIEPNLTFELADNNAGVFGIDDDKVYAVEKTGTATLVVRNIDEKIVGKVKISAGVAKPEQKDATGFRYTERSYNVPVYSEGNEIAKEAPAADFEIEVAPTPNGTKFDTTSKGLIETALRGDITKALHLDPIDVSNDDATNGKVEIDVSDLLVALETGKKLTVCGKDVTVADSTSPEFSEIKAALTGDITIDSVVYTLDDTASTSNKIVLNVKAAGETDIDAAAVAATCKNNNDTSAVELKASDVTVDNGTDAGTTPTSPITFDMHDDNIRATIASEALKVSLVDDEYAKDKNVETSAQVGERTITSRTIIKAVPGKVAIGITAPSSVKIEVGQEYKLGERVKHVASDANIKAAVKYYEDYLNDTTADVLDYACVDDDGVVLGVAVGKNKIISETTYTKKDGGTATKRAETIVEVVKAGTLPKDTDEKVTAPSHITVVVGKTTPIVVKNAGDVTPEFKSYDDKTCTVAADGTVKGLKAGVTVVKVTVGDNDPLYVNVNVIAAPETTDPDAGTGTDVPQTGVSFFAL